MNPQFNVHGIVSAQVICQQIRGNPSCPDHDIIRFKGKNAKGEEVDVVFFCVIGAPIEVIR